MHIGHESSVEANSPEVVVSSLEDLSAVAQEIRHQSWTKVTGQVDGISGFPAEAGTDTENDEEETQRCQWARTDVALILQGVDHEHEQRAGDEFGEELTRLGHEGLWVCAEDSGRGGVAVSWDGADVGSTFVDVDGGFVVCVDDGRGAHGAKDLGEGVDGEFSPGEFAEDAVGEGDCGVEMGTRDTGCVDAKHDSETVKIFVSNCGMVQGMERELLTPIPKISIGSHPSHHQRGQPERRHHHRT